MQHIDLILYPIFNFLRAQSAQIQYLCKCKRGGLRFFYFYFLFLGLAQIKQQSLRLASQ